jgi:hypothetical protein
LIVCVIFVCDRGIGSALEFFYFREEYGERHRATYDIDSTLADILIFGSSRANHSYVPDIFEERFPNTCYNAGRAGTSILYSYAIFKAITMRYNPRMIIFDIDPEEIEYSATEYDRLSLLLPYYHKHPEIRQIIHLRSLYENIELLSAIYPYNSMILPIAEGNLEFKKRIVDIKGYVPLYNSMKDRNFDTVKISSCNIDGNKILALKDIISTCKRQNIDLVFIYSPIWRIIIENPCKGIISELCSQNGISYLDISNYETFINNPDYFADKFHLNDQGARVFSTIISDTILQTNLIPRK